MGKTISCQLQPPQRQLNTQNNNQSTSPDFDGVVVRPCRNRRPVKIHIVPKGLVATSQEVHQQPAFSLCHEPQFDGRILACADEHATVGRPRAAEHRLDVPAQRVFTTPLNPSQILIFLSHELLAMCRPSGQSRVSIT